ncbi:MAG: glutamate decarboxylase [Acidimicrobiales bacterium]
MPLHRHQEDSDQPDLEIRPQFAERGETGTVPRFRIPRDAMLPDTAYQIVHDELLLDGNARLNLATFVTTWMDPQAERLMAECSAKNMIDKDEYPQTAELEHRCVCILADLWHAPRSSRATGCSTTGSSEAAMLAGMAMKWRWRSAREKTSSGAAGSPGRPNLVMGSNVQVCWEKFCRYWEVEPRLVPVGPVATHLTAESAIPHCDENTIGVIAVLGSTYDGAYEPVSEIAAALDAMAASGGPDIPVHVDAASGGFVAPFLDPDLEWDFRVPRVCSINASGHKYGLVYPGVGWVLWRDAKSLPSELVFDVEYLGGHMPTFALNFSRPGAQVVAQYYNFLRLGHDGYRRVQAASRDTARWLASKIEKLGAFELVSTTVGLPVVTFRAADAEKWNVFDLSETLRAHGWLVPAYPMPPALDDVSVLRIVVRNGFSRDLAALFFGSLEESVKRLRHSPPAVSEHRSGFHH